MFKLVIFDLDGTLINAYPAVEESVNAVMKHFGLPPQKKEAIVRAVGWGPKKLLETFLDDEKLDEALTLYYEQHTQALFTGSSLLPGALELLTELKALGCLLAVASNRPKKFSLIVSKHLKVEPLFDRILCGDEVADPKPYPMMLKQIMGELDASAEETLYVGDMVVDIETGKAAGVKTVAVTTGSCSLAEIQAAEPWRIINRVDGVLNLMDQ